MSDSYSHVCDRPGPVLASEIERAKGEEVRGCAEEIRRVISDTIAADAMVRDLSE